MILIDKEDSLEIYFSLTTAYRQAVVNEDYQQAFLLACMALSVSESYGCQPMVAQWKCAAEELHNLLGASD